MKYATKHVNTLKDAGTSPFDSFLWGKKSLVSRDSSSPSFAAPSMAFSQKDLVSERLWDVSVAIVADFEQKREAKNTAAAAAGCSIFFFLLYCLRSVRGC